jgi:hypothetical protein
MRFRPEEIDTAYLDCVAVNLALLLQLAGEPDTRTPFACQWHFAFDPGEGVPRLARLSLPELVRATTGWVVEGADQRRSDPLGTCRRLLERGRPVLVFADARNLAWLPTFQRESMEHTFVLDRFDRERGTFGVLDAYRNATEWGEAVPTETELSAGQLQAILTALATDQAGTVWALSHRDPPAPRSPRDLVRDNAEELIGPEPAQSLEAFRAHHLARCGELASARQLSLGCWLAYRARALHGLWLDDLSTGWTALRPIAQAYRAVVVERWRMANELAYILYRRVRLGKPPPRTGFEVLAELPACERELAHLLSELIAR